MHKVVKKQSNQGRGEKETLIVTDIASLSSTIFVSLRAHVVFSLGMSAWVRAPLVFLPLESRSLLAVSELAGCPFSHSVPLGVCQSGTVVLLLSLVNVLRETEWERMKWACWFHWCTGPGRPGEVLPLICLTMDCSVIHCLPDSGFPWNLFYHKYYNRVLFENQQKSESANAYQYVRRCSCINARAAAKSSWSGTPWSPSWKPNGDLHLNELHHVSIWVTLDKGKPPNDLMVCNEQIGSRILTI